MEDAEFRSGDIEIQWLERRLESLTHAAPPAELTRTAAVVAALIADRDRRAASGPTSPSSGAPTQDAWTRVARLEGLR
jgi:hypothetical protein